MKYSVVIIIILVLVLSLMSLVVAEKQDGYSQQVIEWRTISGGGNTSSDSHLSLSGTVGQAVFNFGNSDAHILHSGFRQTFDPYYVCGDANGDLTVNVSDAVGIINYIFVGGISPEPFKAGDANCDEVINVSDAVSIINYVFVSGNEPCDIDGDGTPDC